MQENIQLNEKDVIVMKLLHYFITDKGYNPVVVRGADNEIWLENLNANYKIIRIISNYIHNDEQFSFDLYKTKSVLKSIKKKTFSLSINTLNIFIDLGDNVNLLSERNIDCVYLKDEKDLKKYSFLYEYFPDINEKMTFTEKGVELFIKITQDINNKNKKESAKAEAIFRPKKPVITYVLMAINIALFLFGFLFNQSDYLVNNFALYGPYVRLGQCYRLISSGFIHIQILHIASNMWALYVIGSQIENFFGRKRYLLIYLFSMLTGSLLSMVFGNNVSIGASGAIFGLLGAMLYFGYYYRVYLGTAVTTRILPVIVLNLVLGFMFVGIDNAAHIGGLVGGIILSSILGVKDKDNNSNRINGIVIGILYIAFLIYMAFVFRG